MWIITRHGFVSLVEHNADHTLIRARARRREHLADTFELFDDQIIDLGPGAPDYRFHADIPKANAAHVIYDAVMDLNYTSHVKEEVAGNDHVMYSAMLDCWRALYRLQDEPAPTLEDDTTSSASRQHYIDTGRYLPNTPTLGDLGDLAGQIGDLADKMRGGPVFAGDLVDDDQADDDWTNPTYVTGSVIAQCEDLSRSEALEVLAQARAAVEGWDR